MDDANSIIERMKQRFGVTSDSDLAVRLFVSRSTVANWRNRNRVPDRYQKLEQSDQNLFGFGGEMTDIEMAAMRLAMLRLARDFGDIATDYRTYLAKSGEAAASVQLYYVRAVQDLANEMVGRDSEDAQECVSLIAFDEVFAKK